MLTMRKAAVLAASICLAYSTPVLADDPWPNEEGDYVTVSMISVDDGHDLEYMTHMAGQYRKGQDYAKAQGWISSYEILVNVNKRPGEPDYYLVTRFPRFADKEEARKRDEAYFAHMQSTTAQMQAASGKRAEYRKVMGSQLLRALVWKK
ncbi:hypothetical protein B0I00_1373 [Novosphingobium kunmingense]|uniref:NIPSNAP protein n=1 Tax=Novosphingobium kunmingense TaxID=1211806 RepID=A0A2N0HJM3_9SPHN|nr:hypothetical protein [Novosphingobium kunmingense]PKB19144.1 hypothetical protein B0I00_1373 [Novosphingobium kunmingense]